jgi:hypothetical protein
MKQIIITLLLLAAITAVSQPLTYEQRYKKGYLNKQEIRDNLCCPCDQTRLDELLWYSAKKGVIQRTDRQYFVIGPVTGYEPLSQSQVQELSVLIPKRPEYPKILLDPELWRYPQDMVQSIVDGYHEDLEYWTRMSHAFDSYINDNYTVYRAHWVLSDCNQWTVAGKSCVWLKYDGDLKPAYLTKLYAILSSEITFTDKITKVNQPIKILP